MSKLEERRKAQKKNGAKGRNIFIGIIVFGAIIIFAVTSSKKEDACNCVNVYEKWKEDGAGFRRLIKSKRADKLELEVERCAKRFNGIDNARKICNE